MNRQIEFRGKCMNDDEWYYGYLYIHEPPLKCLCDEIKEEPKHYIVKTGDADWNMYRPMDMIEVDKNTIGQFTGFFDKNNCKIFEGDIVEGKFSVKNSRDAYINKELLNSNTRVVKFYDNSWSLIEPNLNRATQGVGIKKNTASRFTVVGNLIDGVKNVDN